jgi:hypothetical protein
MICILKFSKRFVHMDLTGEGHEKRNIQTATDA